MVKPALLGLSALLVACTPTPPDTIVFAMATEPSVLDPRLASDAASERVNALLYDRLVELDAQGVPQPGIASWQQLTRAPRYRGPRVWLHGDFHGANILAHDGWLSGVIDFGDVTSGDPAVDLSVAWMLFGSDDEREPLRLAADRHGPGTWRRAQAWALALGAAMTAHSADNPLLRQIGERTLDAATVPGASAARRRRIT